MGAFKNIAYPFLKAFTAEVEDLTTDTMTVETASNSFVFQTYVATVTVANGATTGKEAAVGMPANFLPMCVAINVTTASTNAVNLNDIGDDVDTDAYCDGLAIALNATGFKGVFGCNGVRALGPGSAAGNTGALTTADEVEVVISADPGATGVTMRLTFFGVVGA